MKKQRLTSMVLCVLFCLNVFNTANASEKPLLVVFTKQLDEAVGLLWNQITQKERGNSTFEEISSDMQTSIMVKEGEVVSVEAKNLQLILDEEQLLNLCQTKKSLLNLAYVIIPHDGELFWITTDAEINICVYREWGPNFFNECSHMAKIAEHNENLALILSNGEVTTQATVKMRDEVVFVIPKD